MKKIIKENWEILLFAIALAACFLFAGCKTQERYIYVTNHDTIIQSHLFRDTIDRWQTRYEYVKGDTIYVTDSFCLYKTRYVHDTAFKTIYRDSIVNNDVIKEKKVYVWQPFALLAFGVLFLFLARFLFKGRQ